MNFARFFASGAVVATCWFGTVQGALAAPIIVNDPYIIHENRQLGTGQPWSSSSVFNRVLIGADVFLAPGPSPGGGAPTAFSGSVQRDGGDGILGNGDDVVESSLAFFGGGLFLLDHSNSSPIAANAATLGETWRMTFKDTAGTADTVTVDLAAVSTQVVTPTLFPGAITAIAAGGNVTVSWTNPGVLTLSRIRVRLRDSTANLVAQHNDFTSTINSYTFFGVDPSAVYAQVVYENIGGSGNVTYLGRTSDAASISVVPLPAALPLLLSAIGIFGFLGWRRKRMAAA